MALTLAGAVFAFADATYLHQTGTAIDGDPDSPRTARCRTAYAPRSGRQFSWHFIFNGDPSTVNGHFALRER